MGSDPFSQWGLRSVELTDQPLLNSYFQSIQQPLSDYTFSQLFSWSNSLRILWKLIGDHLCVFANGTGDLTLLMPPIGHGSAMRALEECWGLMHAYNSSAGCPEQSRVEYASDELLARFDRQRLDVVPMGVDYLYDTQRMIDLAGGDLASKRQLKNRFMRNYEFYVETFDPSRHTQPCLELLHQWKEHQDQSHQADAGLSALKRQKESLATQTSLLHAGALGYQGLVVYVKEKPPPDQAPHWEGFSLRGFTFGEPLGPDQASIVIEKTDLSVKGLAQYIFSEFCQRFYQDRPLINAGDDWGLQSLAWTKLSYRPVRLLQKYMIKRLAAVQVLIETGGSAGLKEAAVESSDEAVAATATMTDAPTLVTTDAPVLATVDASAVPEMVVRPALPADLDAAVGVEQSCFDTYCLSKRQLRYLCSSRTAVFLVAESGGTIVGQAIGLVKHHRRGLSGRIYSLAVKPQFRGQGLGHQLMRRMLDELAQRGARRIYLEVESANRSAQRLYENMGFHNIGVLPDYYGPQRDGVHMMYEVRIPGYVAA